MNIKSIISFIMGDDIMENIHRQEVEKDLKSVLYVIFAALLSAFNIKTFVRQGNLIPGGFTGLSLLIQRSVEIFLNVSIPYSIINLSLNAVPAFIGYKIIGKKFTKLTILMIGLNSIFVDMLPTIPITYDPLLVSVFGGILNGVAIVIALSARASSGGTDFLAVYLSQKLKRPSWSFVFGINVIILTCGGLLFGFEQAMYSIIFQFVCTNVIERFHKKDLKETLLIVTTKPAEVSEMIMKLTHHGVTLFEGQGCYLKQDKYMLYTVLGGDDVKRIERKICEIDPTVFINVIKSKEIVGRFYQQPIE